MYIGCESHVEIWQLCEAHTRTIFNDGLTPTRNINVNILASMHAELSTFNHDDTVFCLGDMDWSIDVTAKK